METKGKVRFWLSFPGGFEFWLGVIYKCLLVQGWWEGDRRNFTFAPRRRQIRTRHVIKKFRCLWGLRAFWLMRRLLIGCCGVGEMGLKVGCSGILVVKATFDRRATKRVPRRMSPNTKERGRLTGQVRGSLRKTTPFTYYTTTATTNYIYS